MSVIQPIPINQLIDALLDQSKPFSPRYLNRLSDLGPEDSARLEEVWPQVSLRRREALLEDLEEIHLRDDLQNFEAVARIGLRDVEPGVRTRSIKILHEYELVGLLPTFINMAENDPDSSVRASAAEALSTYIYLGEVDQLSPVKFQRVEECLLKLVSNPGSDIVQQKALGALGYSSRDEVSDLIEQAYSSNNIEWQTTSLFAMGRSANPRWKPKILKMLNHNDPGIRAEAASAAGELEIRDATPTLMELLDDTDIDVRMASIWALSELGGSGVREALENQLESTDDDEEADQIGNALENLDFTDEMRQISFMEIPEDGDEPDLSSEDELNEYDDDLFSEDGDD